MCNNKSILIFGGTTEGRRAAEYLAGTGLSCTVCVATSYGEKLLKEGEKLKIRSGRLDSEGMAALMEEGGFSIVVDATHPYASEAGENIRAAAKRAGIKYLRLKRALPRRENETGERFRKVSSEREAAECLKEEEGNILLTSGVQGLSAFTEAGLSDRLFVRVLPSEESIRLCAENGITGRHVIAMQGPFSEELNLGLIKEFEIKLLVTKISGREGGFEEKLQAADKEGITVLAIEPPEENEEKPGLSMEEIFKEISGELGLSFPPAKVIFSLIGAGGGMNKDLTFEALSALKEAEIVFGSPRLLKLAGEGAKAFPFYTAERIADALFKEAERPGRLFIRAAALFSGDTGFFSGAKNVAESLKTQAENKGIELEMRLLPGISSVSLLSAASGISYDDAELISHHGRKGNPAINIIRNRKTFLLPSDAEDLKKICVCLSKKGYGGIRLCAGFELSNENERLLRTSAGEFAGSSETGLCCAFFLNDSPRLNQLTPGLPDDFFERGRVPMTKEELRELILCKLKLSKEAVFYDIGSGTGSIAVEAARLSGSIRVFALEKNEEACALIRKNAEKAGVENIRVCQGEAPHIIEELPPPTHVFIGGSGGRLKEILQRVRLLEEGPVRVVLSAVTLETLSEIQRILSGFSNENAEFVSVNINRSRQAGRYHIMQAENMVYIISFDINTPDTI
ncbi:MAG: precorrin-6A reductase [Lachnospiraceae bacterium]|nr:precorrin-6A reductase [Lachnospiraceae bacterium]